MSTRPHLLSRSAVALTALTLAVLTPAGTSAAPAAAGTVHHVRAGQSIQAAVDRARPGDTVVVAPGTYRENVTVTVDGIRLRGAGAGAGGTRLVPPATPTGPCVERRAGRRVAPGICAIGAVDFAVPRVSRPLRGFAVSGFAVSGFQVGTLLVGVDDATVEHNRLLGSAEDGVLAALVRRMTVRWNTMAGNSAGLRLVLSPRSAARIAANTVTGNAGEGIGVEDSGDVEVLHNRLVDNAAGIAVLDLPGAARPARLRIADNDVARNNRLYAAGVPVTGSGILLIGAVDTVVSGNRVWGHAPARRSPVAGGIVVRSAPHGAAPADVLVRGNTAYGNAPDLRYDGTGTGVRFTSNACRTSRPVGLCR